MYRVMANTSLVLIYSTAFIVGIALLVAQVFIIKYLYSLTKSDCMCVNDNELRLMLGVSILVFITMVFDVYGILTTVFNVLFIVFGLRFINRIKTCACITEGETRERDSMITKVVVYVRLMFIVVGILAGLFMFFRVNGTIKRRSGTK